MPLHKLARLRGDREGVASTVGTIMALLVILTFMSLIVNQYVPVWSKDSEAAHMNSALGQFGGFKSALDTQVLAAIISQQAGREYIPSPTYSPISLGLDGVPIFASPTIGSLTVNQARGNWTVQFRYRSGASTLQVNQASQGNIVLSVANRYYIPQDLAYENGAIVLSQRAGQAVRVDPQFQATLTGGGVSLAMAQIRLYGSGGIQGTGTEGIRSKVTGADPQLYKNIAGNVYINGTTPYGPGWFQFFNKSLSKTFNYTGDNYANDPVNFKYFTISTGQTAQTPQYIISYQVSGRDYLVTVAILNTVAFPLYQFELDQTFVNVAVGQVTKGTEV